MGLSGGRHSLSRDLVLETCKVLFLKVHPHCLYNKRTCWTLWLVE